MTTEIEKLVVTMEANNAALLTKLEKSAKAFENFKSRTQRALGQTDTAFTKTGANAGKQTVAMKRAIDGMIKSLTSQHNAASMSAKDFDLYQASLAGATSEQKRQIAALHESTAAQMQKNTAQKAAAAAAMKNKSSIEAITRALHNEINSLSMTQQEIQQKKLIALGANAAEIQSITALQTKLGLLQKSYKGLRRNSRAATQQLGFQLQDIAVQAQAGTSAFTIFAQQGSQVAGIFGAGGAMFGALIAVGGAIGGVLFKSMMSAKSATDQLAKAQEILRQSLKETEDGAFAATQKLAKLAEISTLLAEFELLGDQAQAAKLIKESINQVANKLSEMLSVTAKTGNFFAGLRSPIKDTIALLGKEEDAVLAINEAFENQKSLVRPPQLRDISRGPSTLPQAFPALPDNEAKRYMAIRTAVRQLEVAYGATAEEAKTFLAVVSSTGVDASAEDIKALGDAIGQMGKNSPKMQELASELSNLVLTVDKGAKLKAFIEKLGLAGALDNAKDSTKGATSEIEKMIKALEREVAIFGMAETAIALHDAEQKGANDGQLAYLAALRELIDAREADAEAAEMQAQAAADHAAHLAALNAAVEGTIASLEREVDIMGLSETAIILYDAALSKATDEQLLAIAVNRELIDVRNAEAEAADLQTEALRKQAEAKAAFDSDVDAAVALGLPDEAQIMRLQEQMLVLELAMEGATNPERTRQLEAAWVSLGEKIQEIEEPMTEFDRWQDEMFDSMQGNFSSFFEDVGMGLDGLGDMFLKMINKMIADAMAANLMKGLFGANGAGGLLGNMAGGGGFGGIVAQVLGAPSADGGGFTGTGSRSGGLDGKGGFMAMLHPQEQVTDLHGASMSAVDNPVDSPVNVAVVYDKESVLEIMQSSAGRRVMVDNSRKDATQIQRNLSRVR